MLIPAQNLILRSGDLTSGSWILSDAAITRALVADATAPDMSGFASRLNFDAAAAASQVYQFVAVPAIRIDRTFRGAVWMRAEAGTPTIDILESTLGLGAVNVTLSTSWQRFSLNAFTLPGSSFSSGLAFRKAAGTSGNIYVSGVQLVQSNDPAPTFVATAGAAVSFDYAPRNVPDSTDQNLLANTEAFGTWVKGVGVTVTDGAPDPLGTTRGGLMDGPNGLGAYLASSVASLPNVDIMTRSAWVKTADGSAGILALTDPFGGTFIYGTRNRVVQASPNFAIDGTWRYLTSTFLQTNTSAGCYFLNSSGVNKQFHIAFPQFNYGRGPLPYQVRAGTALGTSLRPRTLNLGP